MQGEPWNHNSAFHSKLVRAVSGPAARVLDIGCGTGLLVARLAEVAGEVTGIDRDPAAVAVARDRLAAAPNTHVLEGDALTDRRLPALGFDLVTSVATLHHLPLRAGLERMADLVAPGGRLRVIGLAASDGPADHVLSLAQVVPVRVIGRLRHEAEDALMVTTPPQQSLGTIRRAAAEILPGSRIRRRLYYRYSLEWTKPD